ncbi:MAG: efflux RND transporter periplasmic adaptor subunit [Sulfurimonas sp.]
MIKKSLIFCMVSLLFIGCESKQNSDTKQEAVITVVSPTEQESSKQNEVNGVVESPKIVQIKNRVDGFIEKQYFKDGSFVTKGDILYKIDDRKLKNELTMLKAQLQQSTLNLSNLEKTKSRMRPLIEVGGVSAQELDNTLTLIEKEKAIQFSFQAQIEKLNLDISFATITAPQSGYIEKSQQEEGAYVQANGTMLTQIYVVTPLYFSTMLTSSDEKPLDGKIILGNTQRVGTLKYCDPMTDSAAMVRCRYEFDAKEKIEIGTMGKFIFSTKTKKALFIPQECLVQGANGRSVYVIKDEIASMKKVETGQWVGQSVEILSGISKEDKIAQTGIINLSNNSKIIIKQ